MDKYLFYYDESEHSRVITCDTIIADQYCDDFFAVIIGWKESDALSIEKKYYEFENKYKDKGQKEFKSKIFKNHELRNGFATITKRKSKCYYDFFNIFDDRILIYFVSISKIGYIVDQIFEEYENTFCYDMDALKYIITKAIRTYKPQDVLDAIYSNSTASVVNSLKDFIRHRLDINKDSKVCKDYENKAFNELLVILDSEKNINDFNWNYNIAFDQFKKLLTSKNIKEYSLVIDEEGNGSTINAAIKSGIINCTQDNSKNNFGIRLADLFAGCFKKFIVQLRMSTHYNNEAESIQGKYLTEEWFNFDENKFDLYKIVKNIFYYENNLPRVTNCSGKYADDMILFTSFIQYIGGYINYDQFKQVKNHVYRFNCFLINNFRIYFEKLHCKLSIDFGDVIDDEYVINQQGAKVYIDPNKQPRLDIPIGKIIYEVLSVGYDKNLNPVITIKEESNINCYSLPIELKSWAMNAVNLAAVGGKVFPAKVLFQNEKGEIFVDIL